MKLRVRFVQLPVLFDAERLAAEVAAIPHDAWRPHPQGFPGNDALPLITTDGDPSSDARAGAMGPTPHLLACPYLMQVLETLGATWGRSRLMRLSGAAEVTPHVDTDYYWRDHMRVHVPIVTQPTVRFLCGGEAVNMAAGECWIFDTWSLHSVHNDATRARIHLVADTVGGVGLHSLIEKGRSALAAPAGWSPTPSPPRDGPTPALAYESRNAPEVMSPWELRDHLGFLLGDAAPGQPQLAPITQALARFRVAWHALWARSGDAPAVRPEYAALLAEVRQQMNALGAGKVLLENRMSLGHCLEALIFNVALSTDGALMDGDRRVAIGAAAAPADEPIAAQPITPPASAAVASVWSTAPRVRMAYGARPAPIAAAPLVSRPAVIRPAIPQAADPDFDRPVFIVSSPRSGSTLLFETLSAAPGVATIGGESHGLIEAIPALNPAARGWDSNRLSAADATPETARLLRDRFRAALKDRAGETPPPGPMRMLEKTPKNALRIPFLAAAFPEARFIYLYRDPRPTLASMIEAWSSGHFRTYPQLPGWTGLDWSLLLIPGWRELIGAPLNRIVAEQWATTTRILLDDLAALPPGRWRPIRYDAFVAAPQDEIVRLCRALDLGWDKTLGASLPFARHTVSAPDPEKWRAHEAAIEAVLPRLAAEDARARAALEG